METEKKWTMNDLRNSLIETLDDNIEEIKSKNDLMADIISEYIDSEMPIYHWIYLELAMDRVDLATIEPDIYGFNGKHTAINAIAGNVYLDLEETAYEWREKNGLID